MKKDFFKLPVFYAILGASVIICLLLALRTGSTYIKPGEYLGGILRSPGYEIQSVIIYSVRLPRVLGALLAGIGLSVSGVMLQNVTGNDLAGPSIIGINAGAGFAVMLLLWIAPKAAAVTPFAAFTGAFLTALIIMSVASYMESTRSTVILAGVAITSILNACISFISLIDSDILASYNYFSVGGLSGVTSKQLIIPAVLIFACFILSMLLSFKIDALCLGDGVAASLGIRVKTLRTVCLIIASASAAAVVSFAGLLGFVGLVVPHTGRRLSGGRTLYLLPTSALIGAILVVLADLFGRMLFAPSEIPVGIIMALIGAPFFFILLIRRKNNAGIS